MMKTASLVLAMIVSYCDASIFLQKFYGFLHDTTFVRWQEAAAWQLVGLVIPLLAGPLRVASNIFWNIAQGQAVDYMRAYLYFYGITNEDQFWGYFVDYIVYGQVYGLVGWETDFAAINFAPSDIVCYNKNGYDPTVANSPLPTFGPPDSVATAMGKACTAGT